MKIRVAGRSRTTVWSVSVVAQITGMVSAITMMLVMLMAGSAGAATVKTGDGLAVEVDRQGLISGASVEGQAVPVKGAGGFSVSDFTVEREFINIVPNPGFEDGDEGWLLADTQSFDEEVFHSGSRSVRLRIEPPDTGKSNLETRVPVKPSTHYVAALWLRREKVGVCGAYISERDDANKLTGLTTQVGVTIPKEDGVWHRLVWEFTTQPETTMLSLRSDIYNSNGTLWLDDFFVAEAPDREYVPVTGEVSAVDGGVALDAKMEQMGLALQAKLTGDAECVRIEGVLSDTTGEDRAIAVRLSLPIDAEGWSWYDDAEDHQQVSGDASYRWTYKCKAGSGECSVYPWSALSGPEMGVSLALPLSQGPRVFIMQHDQGTPALSLTFFFGLTRDATNNPSRGPFSCVIYRHDPRWGMRSAMERYYRLYPESFVKRPDFEGYLNYARYEEFDPKTHRIGRSGTYRIEDASDYGEGYNFIHHVHGCYDFRMIPSDDPQTPSDQTVWSWLGEMVEKEKEKPRWYVPTDETMKKIAFGPKGQIRYIGDTRYWRAQEGYNHLDQPGWGLNFMVNEDPDISSTCADSTRARIAAYLEANPRRRAWDACVTADAIEGYFANQRGLNFRREHFATTLVPLTFDKETRHVGMPNIIWDFHKKAWWPITEESKVVVYGNANLYEQMFVLPFVDVPMIEGDWGVRAPERFERFLRASGHHKIWRWWRASMKLGGYGEKDYASVLRHFERGLAYAIYPAVGVMGELADRDYRGLFRQYIPAIEEVSIAGWEPVPYARADEGVVVERYGSFTDGELHLTLRNYAEELKTVIPAIERSALGIPPNAELVAVDILPGIPQPQVVGADWKVEVGADGTRALWIGTREQLAQHGFRLAGRTLDRIERLFATELTDETRAILARAHEVADVGMAASGPVALGQAAALLAQADALQAGLATNAPVDLAKCLFRLRSELGCVAAGIAGVSAQSQRLVPGALRGQTIEVTMPLTVAGTTDLAASVRSPWENVAAASTVRITGGMLSASLAVPAQPERHLLPYLIEVTGQAQGISFTLCVPVDVEVAPPIMLVAQPERVFRGVSTRIVLLVSNHASAGAKVTVRVVPQAKIVAEPETQKLTIPAGGSVEAPVTMRLESNARVGEQLLRYEVTSDDSRFIAKGQFSVLVDDPAPTSASSATPP